jgi:hypothetical protein
MLYDLLEHQTDGSEKFNLMAYEQIYRSVSIYPDGKEIELSFNAMAHFLVYHDLKAVAEAQTLTAEMESSACPDGAIRPSVLTALTQLGQIGIDVAQYHQVNTNSEKLAALAHATGKLNDLHDYVCTEVNVPERSLLQRIIQDWQQLIVSEIGEIGKLEESQKEATET